MTIPLTGPISILDHVNPEMVNADTAQFSLNSQHARILAKKSPGGQVALSLGDMRGQNITSRFTLTAGSLGGSIGYSENSYGSINPPGVVMENNLTTRVIRCSTYIIGSNVIFSVGFSSLIAVGSVDSILVYDTVAGYYTRADVSLATFNGFDAATGGRTIEWSDPVASGPFQFTAGRQYIVHIADWT